MGKGVGILAFKIALNIGGPLRNIVMGRGGVIRGVLISDMSDTLMMSDMCFSLPHKLCFVRKRSFGREVWREGFRP